jgi:hypothetical protein
VTVNGNGAPARCRPPGMIPRAIDPGARSCRLAVVKRLTLGPLLVEVKPVRLIPAMSADSAAVAPRVRVS